MASAGWRPRVAAQSAAAQELGLEPDEVGIAATGVIGRELPRDRLLEGVERAAAELGDGAAAFSEALMTTDQGPKRACVEVGLPSGPVRLAAQAKGAGMISPAFATVLCFLETDARIDPETLDLLTGVTVKRSLERISVDGQLSTSDTVFVLANGASGVEVAPETDDELALGEAMDALLRQLALDIAADGEGARRVGRVVVRGAAGAVEAVARAVADSPLVKTALHGADPNFGRVLQAVGQALAGSPGAVAGTLADPALAAMHLTEGGAHTATSPLPVDLEIEGRRVVSAGVAHALDGAELQRTRARRRGRRGRVPAHASRRGRRDRGLLLRPLARLRDAQRGVHVMKDVATLLEALPYIREYHGRTIVIKYGGAAMTDPALKRDFSRDVTLLKFVGLNPVVVHGGGPDITRYMERLGMRVEFVEGLRVSDAETVEVAKMVLVGKQNKDIVLDLGRFGQPAVGLCGDDGALFTVRKQLAGERDIGFVGEIERVDAGVLLHVAQDYIPVIASVGADAEGHSYNVNADKAAAAVARALDAHKVLFLTDVQGWLADPDDPESRISQATVDEVRAQLPQVAGGMRPKLEACVEAVEGGVGSAQIIDGRQPHSLLLELFTDEGVGTKIGQ